MTTHRYPPVMFSSGMPSAAEMKIASLEARIEELSEGHLQIAFVTSIEARHVYVLLGTETIRVRKPSISGISRGAPVYLGNQNGRVAIVGVAPDVPGSGAIVTVTRLLGDEMVEVGGANGPMVVLARAELKVEEGDRVLMHPLGTAVAKNLGKAAVAAASKPTGIRWDDIGGLGDVKAILQDAIEGPVKNAEAYKRFGRRPIRGIALSGPPGCGKTLLAKAAHTALAELHGSESGHEGGFVYVKGPELLTMWVGKSEEKIRDIFASVRRFKAKHGYQPIVMFDEADGMFARRDRGGNMSGMERTVVPQILAEQWHLDVGTDLAAFVGKLGDKVEGIERGAEPTRIS